MQARGKKRTTGEVEKRRSQLLDHVLKIASDGHPLCVRLLYDSYRGTFGKTTENMPSEKIKLVLKDICNNANAVEYVILKKRDEVPVQEFTPNKRRPDQPPQTLDGTVPIGDRILCYYKNATPRRYGSKRKSSEDAPESEQNCEQSDGGGDDAFHCSSGCVSWGQDIFHAAGSGLPLEVRSNENSRDSFLTGDLMWMLQDKALSANNVAGTEPCLA